MLRSPNNVPQDISKIPPIKAFLGTLKTVSLPDDIREDTSSHGVTRGHSKSPNTTTPCFPAPAPLLCLHPGAGAAAGRGEALCPATHPAGYVIGLITPVRIQMEEAHPGSLSARNSPDIPCCGLTTQASLHGHKCVELSTHRVEHFT